MSEAEKYASWADRFVTVGCSCAKCNAMRMLAECIRKGVEPMQHDTTPGAPFKLPPEIEAAIQPIVDQKKP